MKEKGLCEGGFNSVMQAVGGVDAIIAPDCTDKNLLGLVTYISVDQHVEIVMENPGIVRSGRQGTVGYMPDVWKTWQKRHLKLEELKNASFR